MKVHYRTSAPILLPEPYANFWCARAHALHPARLEHALAPTTFVSATRSRILWWDGDRCGRGVDYDTLPKGPMRSPKNRCFAGIPEEMLASDEDNGAGEDLAERFR